MKIHDKYVIELKEVIKGYGNDPTVQDPFKLPCDYKFYEIDGVAICEESFNKMTPLNDLVLKALEDVRAEIEAKERVELSTNEQYFNFALTEVTEIINRKIAKITKDCTSCTHSDELDGEHCYECVKGLANNFEEDTGGELTNPFGDNSKIFGGVTKNE